MEISAAVRAKLSRRHHVTEDEILECFSNRETNKFLIDNREDHKTNPLTHWFISETNSGRQLKVVYIYYKGESRLVIKTCYSPNAVEIHIWNEFKDK